MARDIPRHIVHAMLSLAKHLKKHGAENTCVVDDPPNCNTIQVYLENEMHRGMVPKKWRRIAVVYKGIVPCLLSTHMDQVSKSLERLQTQPLLLPAMQPGLNN